MVYCSHNYLIKKERVLWKPFIVILELKLYLLFQAVGYGIFWPFSLHQFVRYFLFLWENSVACPFVLLSFPPFLPPSLLPSFVPSFPFSLPLFISSFLSSKWYQLLSHCCKTCAVYYIILATSWAPLMSNSLITLTHCIWKYISKYYNWAWLH